MRPGTDLSKRRALRDLLWILNQPAPFSKIPGIDAAVLSLDFLAESDRARLEKTAETAQMLSTHMAKPRSNRLGIYFEALLSFYFQHCQMLEESKQESSPKNNMARYRLHAQNLQVYDLQRTLGAFDFIVTDKKTNKNYHLEAALKFYLGYDNALPTINNNLPCYNWHQWVGPKQNDTLAIKLNHLFQHQLHLSKTHEGKQALSELDIDASAIQRRLWYCGYFYFPFSTTIDTPKYAHITGPKHYWIKLSELGLLKQWITKNRSILCFLPRAYWLSSVTKEEMTNELMCIHGDQLMDFIWLDEIQKYSELQFAEIIDPQQKDRKENYEIRRWFVVRD
ncbi:MAG: hypothetical protein ACJA04_000585 [Cellvibrionaceae bacterium]|jgi:hypothetical protein